MFSIVELGSSVKVLDSLPETFSFVFTESLKVDTVCSLKVGSELFTKVSLLEMDTPSVVIGTVKLCSLEFSIVT